MAYLKKRGRIYYIRYHVSENGKTKSLMKSLRTRHKDVAEKMVRDLERLEDLGEIDPFAPGYDPVAIYKDLHKPKQQCSTTREAADLFYKKKEYLSPKTIDTYKRAIEHFIDFNGLADTNPKLINCNHFENIIFKRGIKSATRHYYFRQLRTWWNWLLKREIVDKDLITPIKDDLPAVRENTRPKMISKVELQQLFKAFDDDLKRKKKLPEYDPDIVQHWFKPLMAVYFYGGLRKHEAAYSPDLHYSGLKGENLVYDGSELAYIYLPPTKGRKERSVPLIAELRTYLNEYMVHRGKPGPEEYLFVYGGGSQAGEPVRGERAYKVLKHYLDLAGLSSKKTIHGMRHQAVTTWIEAGFHTAEAGYMAGHSSQKVTEKYTHLTAKNLRDKMNKLTED
jgi:site-specific recombinase XerD